MAVFLPVSSQASEWMGYLHFDNGVKLWSKGQYEAAIPEFGYCVNHARDYPGCAKVEDQSHYYLGTIFQMKKNYPRAIGHYERAIAVNPKYGAPRLRLAQILEKSGDLAQAAGHLEKAVEINPRSASAHAALGRVYRDMKEYGQAWKHAREAEKNGGDVKDLLAFLRRVSKEPERESISSPGADPASPPAGKAAAPAAPTEGTPGQ